MKDVGRLCLPEPLRQGNDSPAPPITEASPDSYANQERPQYCGGLGEIISPSGVWGTLPPASSSL